MEIVPLHTSHQKKDFDCGKDLLNRYIQKQASQDVKKKLSACFVLVEKEQKVLGYYTLSNSGIPKESLPEKFAQKLPKSYSEIPATLLGRLAIDKSVKGQGLGELLLIDALKRSYTISKNEIGSIAVIVDPIDEEALHFYKKYGFIGLDSGKIFIPMKTIARLFE